jgi:hypothetical protein
MVSDLFGVEFGAILVAGLDCFAEDGVEGFEEGAVDVEVAHCGHDDIFQLGNRGTSYSFDGVAKAGSLVDVEREQAGCLECLLESRFRDHGTNRETDGGQVEASFLLGNEGDT